MSLCKLSIIILTVLAIGGVSRLLGQATDRAVVIRCLGTESLDAQLLMATVQRTVTRDGRGYQAVRERAFGGQKADPASAAVVTDPSICLKAHRLISTHMRAAIARSDSIAIVRVGNGFAARYRHYAPVINREVLGTYFFDAKLPTVLAAIKDS